MMNAVVCPHHVMAHVAFGAIVHPRQRRYADRERGDDEDGDGK